MTTFRGYGRLDLLHKHEMGLSLHREEHLVNVFRKAMIPAVALTLVAALLMQSMPAIAQGYDPDDEIIPPTTTEKALVKLGRGFANILLGWTEIPVTFDEKYKQGKSLAYLIGVSPVLGFARAAMRTGVGVYEVVTFPKPGTKGDYSAVLEPEYIF